MILQVAEQTTRIKHAASAAPTDPSDSKRPAAAAAMAATRPRRRGNPRIRASAPLPGHLFLYMPPTARFRCHEITTSPRRRYMPPLPSVVWQDGCRHRRGAGGDSGRENGRRMWQLGLVWGLRYRPSGDDTGGLIGCVGGNGGGWRLRSGSPPESPLISLLGQENYTRMLTNHVYLAGTGVSKKFLKYLSPQISGETKLFSSQIS
jgi:hypothetical protein